MKHKCGYYYNEVYFLNISLFSSFCSCFDHCVVIQSAFAAFVDIYLRMVRLILYLIYIPYFATYSTNTTRMILQSKTKCTTQSFVPTIQGVAWLLHGVLHYIYAFLGCVCP